MTSKEADEIKAELKRIEKENQDRRDKMTSWAVIAIIVAIIAFALWNNHRINGNDTIDTGDGAPGGGQCFIAGDC